MSQAGVADLWDQYGGVGCAEAGGWVQGHLDYMIKDPISKT